MCYTKTGGNELGGIELQYSSYFFQVGGHVDHLRGHPDVVPEEWLFGSHVHTLSKFFCNVLSCFEVFYLFKLW